MKRLLSGILIALVGMLLLSCGGGGGGGGSTGLTYTGLSSQATLSSSNSQEMSSAALEGGQSGNALGGGFASVNAEGENSSNENLLFNTVQAVQEAADQIDFDAPPPNPSMAATISETVYGLCGGYARYTITVDDGNGDFFGSMNFVGFCEGTTLLSGKARFSGSLDSDQEAEFFEFSFDMMSVSSNGVAVTMDGTFSMDLTTIPVSITMDLYIQDSLGHVCWIDNYHWAITEDIGFVSVEISGRFYHPHHGFVDLFTESPLIIDDGQIYPKDGILVLQGANNTEAKLIALNQTQCEVTADFDDDGIHEYSSGVLLWENL